MEIKNIEAFLLLARSLNFTKSAEQMFLSQSAFSRQISRLEEELGCQLFHRTKRMVELTTFGMNFLNHAEKIVSEYNRCLYRLNCANGQQGNLRLGILNDLIDDVFPQIMVHFQNQNPEVQVLFRDSNMSGLINKLLREEIDCIYTLSNDIDRFQDISSYQISTLPLYIAMSVDNPLANRASIRMEDLSATPFVTIEPDTYNLGMMHLNYLCQNAGFVPNVSAMVTNVNSLLMLVSCNLGVAMVAGTAQHILPDRVRLFPIEYDDADHLIFQSELVLLWKTNNPNPAVQSFLESVKTVKTRQTGPVE